MLSTKESLARLEHIKSHLDGGFDIQRCINYIETGTGDAVGCASTLSRHANAKGMQVWFELGDLDVTKNWFYNWGLLTRYASVRRNDKMSLLHKTLEYVKVLISDNDELISWCCDFSDIRDAKRIESVTSPDFTAYQIILSVKGDFESVTSRCERLEANPPKGDVKRYLIDNHFFKSLAEGNKVGMEEVVSELVSPKMMKARAVHESGYSQGLISTFAVLYSKIAARHGFKLDVQSPYIPAEWIPVAPLAVYRPEYVFLK
ncbi:Imm49 family immunity protein [Pseudomonas sp. NPDC088444]|uniref:Imm49 family immunity protein n=1 Tax=Pseudomonas sp. NPDC088444 TaxID=3364456 RepID=UPI00384B5898